MQIVQVPARICGPDDDLVSRLLALGKKVVINSPVRGFPGQSPSDSVRAAFAIAPEIIVLTGTRTHLPDTIALAKAACHQP